MLQNLRRSETSGYAAALSSDAISRKGCAPGTRTVVLDEILSWARDRSEKTPPVFWISGLAGQGKTTIAYTVCERLSHEATAVPSVVSFFCSRQLDSHQAKLLVSTIAFELAESFVSYASPLAAVLQSEHALKDKRLGEQMSKLLVTPWAGSADLRKGLPPVVVIVDSLDENEAGTEFLKLILAALCGGNLPGFRFLFTSRPAPEIKDACNSVDEGKVRRMDLNTIPRTQVSDDILQYLREELPEHRKEGYLGDVVRDSDGLFIYASTILEMVKPKDRVKTKGEQEARLRKLTARTSGTPRSSRGNQTILDGLYADIVEDGFSKLDADERKNRMRVLLIVVCTSQRITLPFLAFLADVEVELAQVVARALHPVLYADESGHVCWYHDSFQEYCLRADEELTQSIRVEMLCRCRDVIVSDASGLASDGTRLLERAGTLEVSNTELQTSDTDGIVLIAEALYLHHNKAPSQVPRTGTFSLEEGLDPLGQWATEGEEEEEQREEGEREEDRGEEEEEEEESD